MIGLFCPDVCGCTCARIVFTDPCDRDLTVVDGNSVNWPVDTTVGGKPATQKLPSGTYTWTAAAPNACIEVETGNVTITCPQNNASVTVPVTPATGYFYYSPNCACCGIMAECLTMSVNNESLNGGMFKNTTLSKQTFPTWVESLAIERTSLFSPFGSPFTDPETGDSYWYYASCLSGYLILTRIYETSTYGSPFRDVGRYFWQFGAGCSVGSPSTYHLNTCCPSFFGCGTVWAGGDSASVVILEVC